MGIIKIQDSGYIKPTNAGTQASAANRANSGNAITLDTATFTPSLKRNISAQPELATNIPSEVNLGSLENMQFQLECKLDSTNATDMALIQHLIDMVRTNGYKFMWYQYSNATTEKNNGKLIYQLAVNDVFGHQFTSDEQTEFSVSSGFYHLHVLFFEIQPRQSAGTSIVTYTLNGIVIPVETVS